MMIVVAQGDVMLRKLPDDADMSGTPVKTENGHLIVTHSETGHHHVVSASDCELLERSDAKVPAGMEILHMIVNNPTELTHLRDHDTHEAIALEPGNYEVRRQREYTPEGYRRAQD